MKSIYSLMMMALFAVTLAFSGATLAATDATKTDVSDKAPLVTPGHAPGYPEMVNCPTCAQNAFNKENSCYRNFKDQTGNKNCPATYEKIVDGAEKTEPTSSTKPTSK